MRCWTKLLMGLTVVGLCLALAAPTGLAAAKAKKDASPAATIPEGPKPASLDEAFTILAKYEFGQSREALTMISDALRDSIKDPAARKKLVDRLTALLPSGVTLDAKRFVCRQLSIVGMAESVPPLAALLLDKDLSDYARYAIERIPVAEAEKALLDALPKAQGKVKIGIVNSLGERRDASALAAVTACLGDADAQIASSAASALGKIDGSDAAKALMAARATAKPEVRPVINDALLMVADKLRTEKKGDEALAIYQEMYKPAEAKHVRIAALRGLIASGGDKAIQLVTEILAGGDADMQAAALRFLRETSGPDSAKTVAALLPKSPASAQPLLLDDLAARGDAATLPAVMAMIKSGDAAVRLSAIKAAGKLGDASTLTVLVEYATGAAGPDQDAGRAALDRLPGADVNPALLALAEKGDAKVRAEVLRTLGARRVATAVPVVLKAAADADAGVRAAALLSLDTLADEKSTPAIVQIIVKAKDPKDIAPAEKALASLCSRATNKDACVDPILAALAGAEKDAKAALVRALGRAGGAKALAAVKGLAKDAVPEIQEAAIRSLTDWPDASAAPELLAIAKGEGKTAILAMRGYVRLAAGTDVAAGDKMKMYKEAWDTAKRPDEKRLVLGGLGDLKSTAALEMLTTCLDDPALGAEACAATVKVAKALNNGPKPQIQAAMTKVLALTKDNNLKKEADDMLKAAGGAPAPKSKVNKAPRIAVYKAPADAPKVDLAPADAIGWHLAAQAYTFRAVSFSETIDILKKIGMKYVEIYGGQKLTPTSDVKVGVGMTDEQIAEMKKIAADGGVRIVNFGVTGIGGDEAGARKTFEFGKKVGLEVIVTEEHEDRFPMLAKLADEYKINLSLHNHPKPSYYWDVDHVLKASEGQTRIGSCADTGHWMRSGFVPLDCLKKLKGHIISLHFKDLDKMGPVEKGQPGPKDVPWGTGAGNAKGMLTELYAQGFKGVFSIEYETGGGQELIDNVTKCAEFFAATAAELGKGGKK